jgi:hypothetical protein
MTSKRGERKKLITGRDPKSENQLFSRSPPRMALHEAMRLGGLEIYLHTTHTLCCQTPPVPACTEYDDTIRTTPFPIGYFSNARWVVKAGATLPQCESQ